MDDFKTKSPLPTSRAVIDEEERARRREAMEYAYASVRLEGFTPSAFVDELTRRHIDGEITSEELTSAILAHCKP
jgi:antitoxin VbhA-like protein